MKLANSWAEAVAATAQSEHLYDEYEEYDELDESEDGCGGVEWQQYVLNKSSTSNKMLHELAREIRGVEKRCGKDLTVIQYKTICSKWEDASRLFLQKGEDYFVKLLAKLNRVTVPKGEALQSAFERAKRRQPPSKVLLVRNKDLGLFASLCRELQELARDQPIMLVQTEIAKLFSVTQQTISDWIRALRTLQVLRLAEAAIKNARAARYYFIE